MPLYEHVLIARQDATNAQVDAVVDAMAELLQAQGGTIKRREYWGLRTLTYRIRKNRKGHYVLLDLDATPAAVAELERNERYHEDVLRYLTLRVDAHEEGPSIQMQGRRDREGKRGDRDFRDRDRGGFRDRGDRDWRDRREGREDDSAPAAAATGGEG